MKALGRCCGTWDWNNLNNNNKCQKIEIANLVKKVRAAGLTHLGCTGPLSPEQCGRVGIVCEVGVELSISRNRPSHHNQRSSKQFQ